MIVTYLLLLVPLALVLGYLVHPAPLWTFVVAILAVIPLAEWIRRATDQLAKRAGPAIGGLLNVTFGNTPEFVLALFVLARSQANIVKAQITGSIIGNGLLGLGLAILLGTWGREKQTFSSERAGRASSLLMLSVIALLVPALFDYTERGFYANTHPRELEERLSLGVSIVLICVYAGNLWYTLATRRDTLATEETPEKPPWSIWTALGVLAGATVATAAVSELIADALTDASNRLGVTTFFLGVVVLAVVGNAAEYVAAGYFARKGRLGLAMSITIGSTIQMALLVAPALVLVSYLIGHPMNLVFANPLELLAVAAVAFIVSSIAHDGEANWFEGLMLVSVYAVLALAFFFASA